MATSRIEVKNPAGVNKAVAEYDLPADVWSDVKNVRFRDGKTQRALGLGEALNLAPKNALLMLPGRDRGSWIVGNDAGSIYSVTKDAATDLTRATGGAYKASLQSPWQGVVLNRTYILCNDQDVPQAMRPSDTKFVNLPNWPSNYRTKVMRTYKNYLLALGFTNGSVNQPQTVKWSAPSDPNEVPVTWDVNDYKNDAGENTLSDSQGILLDGMKLKDNFILYKDDSCYTMYYIGGTFIFQFQKLFDDIGIINTNCVASYEGNHFVVGDGDIYIHNGINRQSIVEGKLKSYFFQDIAPNRKNLIHVIPDYSRTEMWVCYSSAGNLTNEYCDKAMVWNWTSQVWTIRDIPNTINGTYGYLIFDTPNAWDADGAAWSNDNTLWEQAANQAQPQQILMYSYTDKKIYYTLDSGLVNGQPFTSLLEKHDITLGDDTENKAISTFTPHVTGNGTMKVMLGASKLQGGAISWKGPYTFVIGQDRKLDVRLNGRYLSVRIEVDSALSWVMNGYSIEVAPVRGAR